MWVYILYLNKTHVKPPGVSTGGCASGHPGSPSRRCPGLLISPSTPLQDGLGREEYLGGGSSSPSDSSSPPTPSDTPTPTTAGQGGQQSAAHPAASQALPVQLTPGLVLASSVPGECLALVVTLQFLHSPSVTLIYVHTFAHSSRLILPSTHPPFFRSSVFTHIHNL